MPKRAWNKGKTAADDERIAQAADKLLKNVVDKEALRALYVEQNMALSKIGDRYGVSKQVIQRLAAEYGLARKRDSLTYEVISSLYNDGISFKAIGKRFNCSGEYVTKLARSYGIEPRGDGRRAKWAPDPEVLRSMYWVQWMSYEQIAAELGVDMTSIPFWMKRFNIPRRENWETRRPRDWQPPDDDLLVQLYEAERLGLSFIGEIFGVSKGYVAEHLRAKDIRIRKSGYPNTPHFVANDGHHVRSGLELQVDNWLHLQGIEHQYEPPIPTTRFWADFLVKNTYIEIWGITGNARYDARRDQKIGIYERLNLALISVYPQDFPQLDVLYALLE